MDEQERYALLDKVRGGEKIMTGDLVIYRDENTLVPQIILAGCAPSNCFVNNVIPEVPVDKGIQAVYRRTSLPEAQASKIYKVSIRESDVVDHQHLLRLDNEWWLTSYGAPVHTDSIVWWAPEAESEQRTYTRPLLALTDSVYREFLGNRLP